MDSGRFVTGIPCQKWKCLMAAVVKMQCPGSPCLEVKWPRWCTRALSLIVSDAWAAITLLAPTGRPFCFSSELARPQAWSPPVCLTPSVPASSPALLQGSSAPESGGLGRWVYVPENGLCPLLGTNPSSVGLCRLRPQMSLVLSLGYLLDGNAVGGMVLCEGLLFSLFTILKPFN